ncbi:type I-E CRISPR-associated protein Cas6/Cse3/CasE [Actinokineospora inagensis]|uniref:type I-E CRISPR-associated protein Cas6/Cse3/CasE n=1 Tax=Actinokineospora inagensis TaxID=103730 RepID=UPI00040CE6BA|nr:type I-E CRISPR-associated protein Cas6/Cse3/CasE [Actinokineospora inagensis]
MYLTQIEINPKRRGTRHLLASPQRMHAAVLACFPADERAATAGGRVLWRVDQRDDRTLLYLASPHSPDPTVLVEQAGWEGKTTWRTLPYQPLLERLAAGETWAFRLAANPVRNKALKPGERSKRLGHVTVAHQQDWFVRQAERHGFSFEELALVVRDRKTWTFNREGSMVTLATAVFEGRLTVTDPEALRAALTHGIGPAKGYGCGLLTLAR